MTVTNQLARSVYLGDGVTSVWPIQFLLLTAADLEVSFSDPATGIVTVQPTSAYTVDLSAGEVTCVVPVGINIILRRNMALVQETSVGNQRRFYAEVVEAALDRIVLMLQQVSSQSGIEVKEAVQTAALLTELLNAVQAACAASEIAAAVSAATANLEALLASTKAAEASNAQAAAQSSADAANAALLNIGMALLQDLGAFTVNADGDLIATYAGNVIQNIEINANGELLMTYEVTP